MIRLRIFLSKYPSSTLIRIWLLILSFQLFILFVIGVLTRLTDSGLSITDWSVFSGIIPPTSISDWEFFFERYKQTSEFQLAKPYLSLSEFKVIFWYEWLHRFWARFCGLFLIIPFLFFWLGGHLNKVRRNRLLFLTFLFLLQGFIGWYMVQSGLVNRVDVSPYRLVLHFGVALLILSLSIWEGLRNDFAIASSKSLFSFSILLLILLYVQILFGVMVSGSGAGKIYNTWPLIDGFFVPKDNLFSKISSLEAFATDFLTIQFIHRIGGYIVLLYIIFYTLLHFIKKSFYFSISLLYVNVAVFFQVIFGISALLSVSGFWLVLAHHIMAIFLFVISLYHVHELRYGRLSFHSSSFRS